VAHADWLVLASDQAPWQDSLLGEQHRKPPLEEPDNVPRAHHIGIRLSPPQLRSYRGGLPQARLRRVLEYMQDHLDQELSLMALAAVAQMSPYDFSRLFKQSTGLSLHQYLLWQRMERAKHLLSGSRRKIAEVSDALGFPHQSHFTTTFHTLVGMTPGEYRRQRSGR
jgi:AraC-like DNA-binding protein